MCVGGGLLAAMAVAAGIVALLLHRAEPFVRARIVEELQTRFHARVELDSFHVSLTHGLRAEGKGLRIWPPAEVEGVTVPGTAGQDEPLIRLKEFRFHAPLRYAPGKPFHISLVELKGMDIHMPPFSHFEPCTCWNCEVGQGKAFHREQAWGGCASMWKRLDCSRAHLVLETSKPGKLPLEFAIAHFKLTNVASGNAMGFDAELTNPEACGDDLLDGEVRAMVDGGTLARLRSPATIDSITPTWPPSKGLPGY